MSDLFCWFVHLYFLQIKQYIPSPSTNTSHLKPVFSQNTFASKSHSCWNLSFLFDNLCFSSVPSLEQFLSRQQWYWCSTFFWSSVKTSLIIRYTSSELTEDFLEEANLSVASEEVDFRLRLAGGSSSSSLLLSLFELTFERFPPLLVPDVKKVVIFDKITDRKPRKIVRNLFPCGKF